MAVLQNFKFYWQTHQIFAKQKQATLPFI